MDIKGWSNLLYKYYFEKGSQEKVVLHISMQDLIDFAKDVNVHISENVHASELEDRVIFEDFVRNFHISPAGNKDMNDLEKRILQIEQLAQNSNDPIVLLSILAVLIMPICDNDDLELHGNDYYGHLYPFLTNNLFTSSTRGTSNFLANIRLGKIWECVNEWAEDNELPFHSAGIVSENGTRQYVRSLMRESLLSPSKLQKFCFIFDHAGLVPGINVENERLLSAFSNYYSNIGIPPTKYKQLKSIEFKESLLGALRNEYDNWDGTSRIKERDRSTGRIRVESGNTSYPLLLQMEFDTNTEICSFALRLKCPDIDDFENRSFVSESVNLELPEVYIKNDGYANIGFPIDESKLNAIFRSRQGVLCIHEVLDKAFKARHLVSDYYVLKLYNNKYLATNEFIKGEFYFIVIRHEAADDFTLWIEENNGALVSENALCGFYSVYRVDSARVELPVKNSLRFKKEVRCKSINNLEVNKGAETDVVYLSKLLPAQFEITGLDVSRDKVYAVSKEDTFHFSSELTYNKEKGLWILKPFSNKFKLQSKFTLYYNEAPIPYGKTYQFSDFYLPTEFKELQLDQWGDLGSPPITTGLELKKSVIDKNLINWEKMTAYMRTACPEPKNSGSYRERDFLLYAITSASAKSCHKTITMPWLKEIRDRISDEFGTEGIDNSNNRYSLNNALADYFRMGYINFTYSDDGLRLAANRPTLILLTPKFSRVTKPGLDGRNIVSYLCKEKEFKCLLTGARTIDLIRKIEKYQQPFGFRIEYVNNCDIIQPQTIYLHAAKRSVFVALAEKCGLLYQDNIYANALLESLPSVEDYITFKLNSGTERDLSSVQSFRSINYGKLATLYAERRALGQAVFNYEIENTDFNDDNDVVSFFPGTRDETTIMIDHGRMIEIDKYWGYFVGMFRSESKILVHDEELCQICLPQQFRLPLLYARALTLLTGNTN